MSFAGSGSRAHAQAWLPDRNYTEGPGFRVGDVELHPGIVTRGGYTSNVFLADDRSQPRRSAGILAITPHLHVATLGALRRAQGEDRAESQALPKLAFRLGASATYFHYFVEGAPKNLEVDTDGSLTIMPGRPVSVDIQAGYVRNVRPFAQRRLTDDTENDYVFNVITPTVRLNFSSPSRVLSGHVGYAPRIQIFESEVFDYLNSYQHGIVAGAAWRFLPSTALVYDAQLDLQDYKKEFQETNSPVVFTDSKRFRTRAGLNGALTQLVTFRVMAGYSVGFFDDAQLDDFEAAIADVSLTYRFGPAQTRMFSLGYQRDVQGSALGGWAKLDRGFASLSALLGQAFQLNLEAGAAYIDYGRMAGRRAPTEDGMGARDIVALGEGNDFTRSDLRVDGAIRGEYRATNWLAFTADFSVAAVLTEFEYAAAVQGSGALPDPAEYVALSAFGGVRFHY